MSAYSAPGHVIPSSACCKHLKTTTLNLTLNYSVVAAAKETSIGTLQQIQAQNCTTQADSFQQIRTTTPLKNCNKRTNVCRSTMPDIDVAIAYTMGRACSEGKAMQRPAVRAITCCIILHYFALYITFLTKSHYFMSVLLSSCQSVYLLLLCLRTVSALRCLFSISAFLRNG